jgi:ABC-type transport system involved in multi-copper enzyme maturation permease subunit
MEKLEIFLGKTVHSCIMLAAVCLASILITCLTLLLYTLISGDNLELCVYA